MATYYEIAKYLDSINGEVVGTGGFSDFSYLVLNTGDKGSEFKEKINTNFFNNAGDHQAFYDTFESVISALNKRIISEDVKQIKIENGKLYYTIDGINWLELVSHAWGDITGNIESQADLMKILNSKATIAKLTEVSNSVTSNTNAINALKSTTNNHENRVVSLENDLSTTIQDVDDLQNNIKNRVIGNGIKQIKELAGKIVFSFQDPTEPNPIWTPITTGMSAQVSWGNITGGDPGAQLDLVEYLGRYLLKDTYNTHTGNYNNPHKVTKAQVGLGNVDNTADIDKPVPRSVTELLSSYLTIESYNNDIAPVKEITDSVSTTYATIVSLNDHLTAVNPHNITKETLGLENVDNTADVDKPISNAVLQAMSDFIGGNGVDSIWLITKDEYDALEDKSDSILYFIK